VAVDAFLYASEPNPNDCRLSDPTVLRGGGPSYYAILKRRIGGTWQKAKLMLETGGTGHAATMYVRVGGVQRSVDTTGV